MPWCGSVLDAPWCTATRPPLSQCTVAAAAAITPAGSLPQALGFCKDLLYLDLSGHSLSGSLPALPPSIQFLNVSSNGLTGSLPEFAVDAQLQYLDLSFNRCVAVGSL